MNSREIKKIEDALKRAKTELQDEISKKKRDRQQHRLDSIRNRIKVLKSWLVTDTEGEKVKETPVDKIVLTSQNKEELRLLKVKEFEAMLIKLDADPESDATMALTSTYEVDAVFNLIQREIRAGRKNLVFVWPKHIIAYYRNRVRTAMQKISGPVVRKPRSSEDRSLESDVPDQK